MAVSSGTPRVRLCSISAPLKPTSRSVQCRRTTRSEVNALQSRPRAPVTASEVSTDGGGAGSRRRRESTCRILHARSRNREHGVRKRSYREKKGEYKKDASVSHQQCGRAK